MPTITVPVVTQVDGHWQGAWEDGYTLVLNTYDASRSGIYRVELDVLYQGSYLTTEGADLLNRRSREDFMVAMSARNGVAPIGWDDRLVGFYKELRQKQTPQSGQSPWAEAQTAKAFLLHEEQDLDATVQDFIVPGCNTIVSAPRGSGKTFVALFLGVALAQGGIFRFERLARQRVLLIDRDNPQELIRKRLRALGADDL